MKYKIKSFEKSIIRKYEKIGEKFTDSTQKAGIMIINVKMRAVLNFVATNKCSECE